MAPRSAYLFEPVDNAGLVVFRILFGTLMVCECAGSLATGWVRRALLEPELRFPVIGFEWVPMPAGEGVYVYYAAMAVLAAMVAAGAFFRPAVAAFTVLWAGAYVAQSAHYNNHYYLILLLSALLWTTPAAGDASLDAWRDPARRSRVCPRWCYTIFIAQTAILYGYAAYAKLQPDWLAARPLELWLEALARVRPFGEMYSQPGLKWLLAWGGLAFDALVVPALLVRRTRGLAVAASLAFHLFNSLTFRIGVFPYLGLALEVFFFSPRRMRSLLPGSGDVVGSGERAGEVAPRFRTAGIAVFAIYFAVQLALPLRHHFYPGDVDWHDEGYTMSWRMMLRAKSGRARFFVRDPASGAVWEVNPAHLLTRHQAWKLPGRPDMIWRFARHLKREYAAAGYRDVEVFGDVRLRLNGRPRALLVEPTIDLAAVPWRFFRFNDWLTHRPRGSGRGGHTPVQSIDSSGRTRAPARQQPDGGRIFSGKKPPSRAE